jgi:hypothetical protein
MAVESENVQKLMEWLAPESPARSTLATAEILAQKLAAVVFHDDAQWADRPDQADSYRDTLSAWFAADGGHEQQFAALTAPDADPGTFVDWFLPVVTGWEVAAGQQSAAAQDGGDGATSEQGRYSEPARDDTYGLTYRYDHEDGVYEWYDEAGHTWQNQAWADQHAVGGQSATAQAPETSSPADPAPEWDENWNMFYRVDAGGAYQFADAVTPGDRSSGCGDTWLSHEQVLARAAGQQQQTAAAGPRAAAADAVHSDMLAAVGSVLDARPELGGILTDEHIKAVMADVANELIGERQGGGR